MSKRSSTSSAFTTPKKELAKSGSWEVNIERIEVENIDNPPPKKISRILPEKVIITVTTEEPELQALNTLVGIPCGVSSSTFMEFFNLNVPGLYLNASLYQIQSRLGKIVVGLHDKPEHYLIHTTKRLPSSITVRVVKIAPEYNQPEIVKTAFQTLCNTNNFEEKCYRNNGMEIKPFKIEDGAKYGITTSISSTILMTNDFEENNNKYETIDYNSVWRESCDKRQNEKRSQKDTKLSSLEWVRSLGDQENMHVDEDNEFGSTGAEFLACSEEKESSKLKGALMGHDCKIFDGENTEDMIVPDVSLTVDNRNLPSILFQRSRSSSPVNSEASTLSGGDFARQGIFVDEDFEMEIQRVWSQSVTSDDSGHFEYEDLEKTD